MERKLQKLSISSREKTEKKTEWFDLPCDIRLKIITMMDIDTKLSYLLCSDRCAADMPKNTFKTTRCSYSGRVLNFSEKWNSNTTLYFEEIGRYVIISKTDYPRRTDWEFPIKGNLSEMVAKYFQRIIGNSTNLQELRIRGDFPFETTSIKHLKLSKDIIIDTESDQNLSSDFLIIQQLYRIIDTVTVSFNVTPFQLHQIRAKKIIFEHVKFSSNFINQYLKFFIDGQIHRNVQSIYLKMAGELDKNGMTDGLEVAETYEPYVDEHSYFDDDFGFSLVSKDENRRVGVVRCCDGRFTMKIYSKQSRKSGHWCSMDEYHFDVSRLLREDF